MSLNVVGNDAISVIISFLNTEDNKKLITVNKFFDEKCKENIIKKTYDKKLTPIFKNGYHLKHQINFNKFLNDGVYALNTIINYSIHKNNKIINSLNWVIYDLKFYIFNSYSCDDDNKMEINKLLDETNFENVSFKKYIIEKDWGSLSLLL